jgi:hypothetical protein
MKIQTFLLNLLESFRLTITIPAALLVALGYRLTGHPVNGVLMFEILLIASTTMLTNDYYDKENDKKKGKEFASAYWYIVLPIIIYLWQAAIFISFFCFKTYGWNMVLLYFCIGVGIFYSVSRKLVLLPAVLVAITGASPTLFAFVETHRLAPLVAFVSIALIQFGREIVKDSLDSETDTNYKKTVFTQMWMEKDEALHVALMFIAIGLGANTLLIFKTHGWESYAYLAGLAFAVSCMLVTIVSKKYLSYGRLKDMIDIGTVLMLISLIFS